MCSRVQRLAELAVKVDAGVQGGQDVVVFGADAPDPVSAWRDHMTRLRGRAAVMQQRNFSALRFRAAAQT